MRDKYTGLNDEYKVEFDGLTYEFESFDEMDYFLKDHGIHG